MIEIPDGDFYDCLQHEQLQCTSAEEAVEGILDLYGEAGHSIDQNIADLCPIELTVWRRKKIEAEWVALQARRAVDEAVEYFEEEYCTCADGPNTSIMTVAANTTIAKINDALVALFANAVPFDCEVFATVTLDAEQVTAMMREHCPEWFDEKEDK